MITYRCNYYRLLAGMASLATDVWPGETEQCPNAATFYVWLNGQVWTHWVNLCTEHDVEVRQMPGWVSSEPKAVYA